MVKISDEFTHELNMIHNSDVRDLVIDMLDMGPEYFLTSPSSVSLKYHPVDEMVEGGKVLHTRRVFWTTKELCRSQEIFGIEKDCLLGAALVHDLWFRGPAKNPHKYTMKGHEDYIYKETASVSNRKYYDDILELAASHGGIWCHNKNRIPPKINKRSLLHIADYVSSRRGVSIPITNAVDVKEESGSRKK